MIQDVIRSIINQSTTSSNSLSSPFLRLYSAMKRYALLCWSLSEMPRPSVSMMYCLYAAAACSVSPLRSNSLGMGNGQMPAVSN